jgi:hypothetical protein
VRGAPSSLHTTTQKASTIPAVLAREECPAYRMWIQCICVCDICAYMHDVFVLPASIHRSVAGLQIQKTCRSVKSKLSLEVFWEAEYPQLTEDEEQLSLDALALLRLRSRLQDRSR